MRARHFIKGVEARGMKLNERSESIVFGRVAFGQGVGIKRFGHAQRMIAEAEYRERQATYLKSKKAGYQCWQPDRVTG